MYNVTQTCTDVINIGMKNENLWRCIEFDVSQWKKECPQGIISIVFRRPDGQTYPVTVQNGGNTVAWRPNAADTAVPGEGRLEVRITAGGTVGKSRTYATFTFSSLDAGETPEQPAPDWIQTVTQAAETAMNAVSMTPYIGANGNWYVWDGDEECFADSGIAAHGDTGPQGPRGQTSYVAFETENGELYVSYSGDDYEPDISINANGELEVDLDG